MDKNELINGLRCQGLEEYKPRTLANSFATIKRTHLIAQQVNNRSSADWKKAMFIICTAEDQGRVADMYLYIKGWQALAKNDADQALLFEQENGIWDVYDSNGKLIKSVTDGSTLREIVDNYYVSPYQSPLPLQQIFYGAPGTGKSHIIDETTKDYDVIRTTFHPDSDYSTFVGAYKPVMEETEVFAMPVTSNKNGSVIEDPKVYKENKIVYKFTKQAFLKAYLAAWRKYSELSTTNCCVNSTTIQTSSMFQINSVDDDFIICEKNEIFKKSAINKVWDNLWKSDTFEIPTGQKSGASVQEAISKWIYDNNENTNDFEKGWNELMRRLAIATQEAQKDKGKKYTLSRVGNNDESVKVTSFSQKNQKDTLRGIYNGNTVGNGVQRYIVSVLKQLNEQDFDSAWNSLKGIVNNSTDSSDNSIDEDEIVESNECCSVIPQFLVIEEINRGNCAQIFGDIFQLLDRQKNNDKGIEGFSCYPIEADADIQKAIKRAFEEEEEYRLEETLDIDSAVKNYKSPYKGQTLSSDVQEGRVLLLPPNLHIWASMNTSDQSLFPMDSAFKRRWDWEYEPILEGKQGGKSLDWKIKVDDNYTISWWDFLQKINDVVFGLTNSEDKQLGYFFCQPDNKEEKTISKDLFVKKVIFYLWNDVFKDYAFDTDCCKNGNGGSVKFSDFFKRGSRDINPDTLKVFFERLKLQKTSTNNAQPGNTPESDKAAQGDQTTPQQPQEGVEGEPQTNNTENE